MAANLLAYLVENPQAQDTLEGIVEWWLLERRIKHQMTIITEVLADLVARGLIIERQGKGLQTHYRINRRRRKEIAELLKQRPD